MDNLFGKRWTIRLEGIDAPENEQPYGLDARNALRRAVLVRQCHIEWKKRDRYKPVLGHLFVGKPYINIELVKAGFAWHYKKHSNDKKLALVEREARTKKLGLRNASTRIAPFDWRNRVKTATLRRAASITRPAIVI